MNNLIFYILEKLSIFGDFKMKKNMMPSNGHRIHGFSSETFIDARDIIKSLDLKGNEVFMDAGCGDGHAAMIAHHICC